MQRPTVTPQRYLVLTRVALGLVAAIIVTGASVRLSGSGLGCDDWPNCTAGELIQVTNKNQAIEQINRLFTGLVSLGVIAAVFGSYWRVPRRNDLTKLSYGLIAGVLLQAVIGGISVLLELQWQSVAVHFLASIVLVAVAIVLHRRAGEAPGPYRSVASPRTVMVARVALVEVVWILVAGTLVTAAGPHGGDEKATRLDWSIPSAARLHGVSVMVFIATVLVLFVLLRADRAPGSSLRCLEVVLALGVAQAAIGYIQYLNDIPALLVGVHVAGSVLVFSAVLWLQLTLRVPTSLPESFDIATAHPRGSGEVPAPRH